ncbi:MAG: hypothetical protein KAR42_03565 [candidate division Zixibacteria bacterium]|nr:hypothetical protein [candidate division Zixibacteria bacterium]
MKKQLLNRPYEIYDGSRILRLLIVPLILGVPPLLFAANSNIPFLKTFFDNHTTLATICIFWPVLYLLFHYFIEICKPRVTVDLEQLMSLFAAIDYIMGAKIERFGNEAKSILSQQNMPTDDVIFQKITQPIKQIDKIVEFVWHFFRSRTSDKNIDFRVALARMGEKHIEKYEFFQPMDDGPISTVEDLQNDCCGFSRAKQRGKIIIIPDIQLSAAESGEKCNFVITSEENKKKVGSMICYPIRHRNLNSIPYVLSISASKKGYFDIDNKETYEFILSKFAKRLSLEYGLLVLKGKKK